MNNNNTTQSNGKGTLIVPNENLQAQRVMKLQRGRKEKHNMYGRHWRANHPTTLWFARYKATLRCLFCGEGSAICLDFHHKDPSTKKGAVANLVRDKRPIHEVEAEIAKCIVVCRNCHAKLHAGAISADLKESVNDAI